jgi:hypothetical protein
MTFPTPAQRGWFGSNYESPMQLEGHAPAYTALAAGQYLPACRCDCLQGDPGLLPHTTWLDALDDARTILTHRIHGGPE